MTHDDIVIPGNGGMDVRVSRSYTSPIKPNSAGESQGGLGFGWVMHFGQVVGPDTDEVCVQSTSASESTLDNPSIELSSGARELMVQSSIPGVGGLITRSNLRTSCFTIDGDVRAYSVRTPDGTRYDLQYIADMWRVTQITDINDNWIRAEYFNGLLYKIFRKEEYEKIQPGPGQTKNDFPLVAFEYEGFFLKSIQYDEQIWTYTVEPVNQRSGATIFSSFQLKKVVRPDGKEWNYEYHPFGPSSEGDILGGAEDNPFNPGSGILSKIIYPDGGEVRYEYEQVQFDQDNEFDLNTTVRKKTLFDPITNKSADWIYTFEPRSDGTYPGASTTVIDGQDFNLNETVNLDVVTVESPFGKTVSRYLGKHIIRVNEPDLINPVFF